MNNIKKFDDFLDRMQELINEAKNQLEKQGEKKSDIIFLKFRIGDKVTNGEDTYTINFIGKDRYWVKEHDCVTIPFEYQHNWELVEQKTDWSEEDEYLLDETIQHLEELIRIEKAKYCGIDVQYYQRDIDFIKSIKNRVFPQSKQEWSEEDENFINYILINCMNYVKECGLVKELHNDELHERAKIFLKSLKERIQQKKEWSEEDKCMLNNIIDILKPLSQTTHSGYAINSMINWLKEKYS